MAKKGVNAGSMAMDPDSLLDTVIKHQKTIIVAAIVLAAAAAGGWLWKRSAEIKEIKAAEALTEAEGAFGAGNYQLAQPELERIFTRYKGTSAGTQAAMLLAQIHLDTKNADAGLIQLKSAVGSAPKEMKPQVMAMIAAAHEAAGQRAEAAAEYEKAASAARFREEREALEMSAARNHAAAGNTAAAIAIYQTISTKEDSQFNGEAKVRLGEIKAAG